jgi:hypothetical protein
MSCNLHKYGMNRAYSIHGVINSYTILIVNMKRKETSRGPGLFINIISLCCFKNWVKLRGLNSTESGYCPVRDYFEYGDEPSGSIKSGNCLTS